MMRLAWPIGAIAMVIAVGPAVGAQEKGRAERTQRIYGPLPAPAPRVYGPQLAPGTPAASHTGKSPAGGTDKIAASREVTKPAVRPEEGTGAERTSAAKSARPEVTKSEAKRRPVTIYFVHGDEKQSIIEFPLPDPDGQVAGTTLQRAMAIEANTIEADVDGKLLLRGDVRIRFANGMRLGAQLVSVTVGREEGPVEIIVKE